MWDRYFTTLIGFGTLAKFLSGTLSSFNTVWTQRTSVIAWAKFMYSASAQDLATTGCFMDHQEMRLGPKNIAAPEVDLLSSGSATKSASQKTWREISLWVGVGYSFKPKLRVHFRYLKILLTAIQWVWRGLDINWQTLLTKYTISGLVIVAYCRELTTDLEREVSWKYYKPCLDTLQTSWEYGWICIQAYWF